jgi:hypothetical protein
MSTDTPVVANDSATDTEQPKDRLPWFKFYPADWNGDELLPMCSLAARGLLIELLCVMHRATPYGHLLINGKTPSDAELARLVRATSPAELKRLLAELLDRGVLSRTYDAVIYSRRMVRKAQQRAVGQETGRQGGNPKLKPQSLTPTLNPNPKGQPLTGGDNTQKPEARSQNPIAPEAILCDDALAAMANEFLRLYPIVYARCRAGAFYRVREARDFPCALELVNDYQPLDRLEAMLEVFLRRQDTAHMGKPGSPRQFQHYAPDCDRLLRENGR